MRRAPETLTTARLVLRRPLASDAAPIFARYSSDPHVTRYVGWPTHRTLDDARAFLAFSDAQWERWPAGPYLVCSRDENALLGSTGLMFESADTAMTGYVLAADAWGRGYASEALAAMIDLACAAGVRRLYALCHAGHRASAHVLEKCGFVLEETRRSFAEFPNLRPGCREDVLCYGRLLGSGEFAKCS